MKRLFWTTACLAWMPVMMIGLSEVYGLLASILAPDLDSFEPTSYMPTVLGVFASTVAAAAVALIAGIGSALLFRGHGFIVSLFCCAPIFYSLWPWNPVLHDFHWTALHWAVALHEIAIVALLVLWVTRRTRTFDCMRSNNALQATREDARA